MKIYHVETQQDYDALMVELEVKGYKWLSGHKLTHLRYWEQEKKNTCIAILGKYITFNSIKWHKKKYPDTPIIEYKVKGDTKMSEKECAKCHEKRSKKAIYCQICGNKLVENPMFKVGDYVTDTSDDDPFICKIEEFVGNDISGKWYCVSKKYFDKLVRLPISDSRLSTKEEIAEYEAALTFHERGRKPFEVKDGDLLGNVFWKYIAHEHSFSKEDFTVGGNTLLKTVEEVNEWLGVSDE